MDMRQAVAERILALCKEHEITPNALSYNAGVPEPTIKSILSNESHSPGIVTIKKLCDYFEITMTDFFDTDTFGH